MNGTTRKDLLEMIDDELKEMETLKDAPHSQCDTCNLVMPDKMLGTPGDTDLMTCNFCNIKGEAEFLGYNITDQLPKGMP